MTWFMTDNQPLSPGYSHLAVKPLLTYEYVLTLCLATYVFVHMRTSTYLYVYHLASKLAQSVSGGRAC